MGMRELLLVAAAGLSLAACGSLDRTAMTDFEPTDAGFRYRAPGDGYYDETDRQEWLGTYLRDAGMCRRGYEITSRREVPRRTGMGLPDDRVYYEGRCKA